MYHFIAQSIYLKGTKINVNTPGKTLFLSLTCKKCPFTLVNVDIDNKKQINRGIKYGLFEGLVRNWKLQRDFLIVLRQLQMFLQSLSTVNVIILHKIALLCKHL